MKNHLIISLLILSVGFSQRLSEVIETYDYGNIKSIKYHKKTRDRIEKVKFEKYYENGQKEKEGTYKDGEKDGLFTIWYLSGDNKKTKMYYKKNVLHGSHKRYNKKDEVTYHVIYIDDLPEIFVFGDFYDPQSYPKWESSIDKSLKHLKDLLNDGFINEEDYILFKIDLLKDEKYWNEDGSVKE